MRRVFFGVKLISILLGITSYSSAGLACSKNSAKKQRDAKLSSSILASSREGFPAEWWAAVPRQSAASWEILPQDAGPGEVILSKRNELGILSNFSETPFVLDGQSYRSVEGFWQMMKFPESDTDTRIQNGVVWPHQRQDVAQMISFEAKKAGDFGSMQMKKSGINWVTYQGVQLPYRIAEKGDHYALIVRAMRAKLEQNAKVKEVLLKTKQLILKPDHKVDSDQPPAWNYFDIWMDLRKELDSQPAL